MGKFTFGNASVLPPKEQLEQEKVQVVSPIIQEKIVYIDKPIEIIKEVEVIKEVPVDVVKEVLKIEEKIIYVDRPIEVIKNIDVIKEVEVTKVEYIDRIMPLKYVPKWLKAIAIIELVVIAILLFK